MPAFSFSISIFGGVSSKTLTPGLKTKTPAATINKTTIKKIFFIFPTFKKFFDYSTKPDKKYKFNLEFAKKHYLGNSKNSHKSQHLS